MSQNSHRVMTMDKVIFNNFEFPILVGHLYNGKQQHPRILKFGWSVSIQGSYFFLFNMHVRIFWTQPGYLNAETRWKHLMGGSVRIACALPSGVLYMGNVTWSCLFKVATDASSKCVGKHFRNSDLINCIELCMKLKKTCLSLKLKVLNI